MRGCFLVFLSRGFPRLGGPLGTSIGGASTEPPSRRIIRASVIVPNIFAEVPNSQKFCKNKDRETFNGSTRPLERGASRRGSQNFQVFVLNFHPPNNYHEQVSKKAEQLSDPA